MDKDAEDKLSKLIYDIAEPRTVSRPETSDESIDKITKDKTQREVLKAAVNEFTNLTNPERITSPDAAKRIVRDAFSSTQSGGADLDSGIRGVARGLGLDFDAQNELSSLVYDIAESKPKAVKKIDSVPDELTDDDAKSEILKEALREFYKFTRSAPSGLASRRDSKPASTAKKIMSRNYDSSEAGGADLDSGIRQVAQSLGMDKEAEDKLSKLIYDIAEPRTVSRPEDSNESIDKITKDKTQREILKAAVDEFTNLTNPERITSPDAAKRIIRDAFSSTQSGGADLDSGIRGVARGLGLDFDAQVNSLN